MAEYPQEGVLARRPYSRREKRSVENGDERRLRPLSPRAELAKIYLEQCGLKPDTDTVVYCRIGERSSHTWFVLTYLLGLDNVRNYDGSWTEWGNKVGAPIEKGA